MGKKFQPEGFADRAIFCANDEDGMSMLAQGVQHYTDAILNAINPYKESDSALIAFALDSVKEAMTMHFTTSDWMLQHLLKQAVKSNPKHIAFDANAIRQAQNFKKNKKEDESK